MTFAKRIKLAQTYRIVYGQSSWTRCCANFFDRVWGP